MAADTPSLPPRAAHNHLRQYGWPVTEDTAHEQARQEAAGRALAAINRQHLLNVQLAAARRDRDRAIHDLAGTGLTAGRIARVTGMSESQIRYTLRFPRPTEA